MLGIMDTFTNGTMMKYFIIMWHFSIFCHAAIALPLFNVLLRLTTLFYSFTTLNEKLVHLVQVTTAYS